MLFRSFQFPQKTKLDVTVKDILSPDEDIDDKYYLTKHQLKYGIHRSEVRGINTGIISCLTTHNPKRSMSDCVIIHSRQERSINRPSCQKAIKEGKPLPGGVGHLSKQDGTTYCIDSRDRKSTRLNSSHIPLSRMPSSA